MNLFKRENGVWYIRNSRVERRLLGLPQAISLKTEDESLARAKFQQLQDQRRDRQVKSIEKVNQIKLTEYIPEYLASRELQGISQSTISIDANALKKFKETIGDMTLRAIKREQVDRFKLISLRINYSKTYINIMLRSLSAAFTHALTLEKPYISVNPFSKRDRNDKVLFKMDEEIPRYLQPAELDRLFEALDKEIVLFSDKDGFWHIKTGLKQKPLLTRDLQKAEATLAEDKRRRKDLVAAVYIYLYTGMRRSELIKLNRQDVDLVHGLIYVRQTKGNRDRAIPICDKVRPYLERIHPGIGPLFPNWSSPNTLSRLFRNIALQAGVKATLHSLRHTFASYLVMKGEGIKSIKDLLGHRNLRTTEIYAKLDSAALLKTVNKLDF
ncbi:MAG: site-specific integrase [Thermodesulfovibrionia bacterium]|nr:site-specific integrase [Thermodesulfovibrionia bacterium]